jgi:DNA-directed RNA polymerase specialized sigma subunit
VDAERRIRRNIEDILQNHDQEIMTIDAQIEAERAALEADLESIRARAYPSIKYDDVRVQTTSDPDGKMVHIVEAIERRRKRAERNIAALEERRRQIEAVYHNILSLDTKSKCVLLTLYYPKRTYEEAAEILNVDVSTIARRRKAAITSLVKRFWHTEKNRLPANEEKCVKI